VIYGEKVFIVSNCDEHERIYNEQFGMVVDTFTDDNGHRTVCVDFVVRKKGRAWFRESNVMSLKQLSRVLLNF
jgi:hypothetical protein